MVVMAMVVRTVAAKTEADTVRGTVAAVTAVAAVAAISVAWAVMVVMAN